MEGSVDRVGMLGSSEGRWVFPNSAEFLDCMSDQIPDYDSISFAVKNLGFIKVVIIERLIIELELDPRNVELPALLAVQQQLLSSGATLFRIKYFDKSWHSEISSSPEQTISRLSELCAPVFMPQQAERFIVEPRDPSELFSNECSPLRPLAQKWKASFGHFDPTVISFAGTHHLLSAMMIAGIKPNEGEPVWRFIGDNHKWIGTKYMVQGIGEKVGNMPDNEYGTWAADFYKTVAGTGQPRYDYIRGAVRFEDKKGKPRKPIRYARLMLTWKRPSAEAFVS